MKESIDVRMLVWSSSQNLYSGHFINAFSNKQSSDNYTKEMQINDSAVDLIVSDMPAGENEKTFLEEQLFKEKNIFVMLIDPKKETEITCKSAEKIFKKVNKKGHVVPVYVVEEKNTELKENQIYYSGNEGFKEEDVRNLVTTHLKKYVKLQSKPQSILKHLFSSSKEKSTHVPTHEEINTKKLAPVLNTPPSITQKNKKDSPIQKQPTPNQGVMLWAVLPVEPHNRSQTVGQNDTQITKQPNLSVKHPPKKDFPLKQKGNKQSDNTSLNPIPKHTDYVKPKQLPEPKKGGFVKHVVKKNLLVKQQPPSKEGNYLG